MQRSLDASYSLKYHTEFKESLARISLWATLNPLDTIAEDIARKVPDSLDAELNLTRNPFKASPYPANRFLSFFDFLKIESKEEKLEKRLLKEAWTMKIN